ncbi:MAG TPA: multidrug effflux MFS transporter [Chitinophagaceae bacterium]|nr:multidrug effflux MFS transporter [Chitinophagaceae bacterium]
MKHTQRSSYTYLIIILGLLTAIGPFSIDMYLPAFPEIAEGLSATHSQVMLSLSSFFIGISAGQLIYGPLLERYGRKKPMFFGLFLYLLASVGCMLAGSVQSLIAFRLLQALGGCAGMVAARAVVRDMFEPGRMAKIFSSLILVVAISPIVAPTLGGYITAAWGWRYVFGALILMALIILTGIMFMLPETKQPDPTYSLKPKAILRSFGDVFKNSQFNTYAFTGAIAAAGLYAYISGSPFVFMELFHVSEKQYGWIFAFIAFGLITASQVNNLLLRKYKSEQIVKASLICQAICGTVLLVIAWIGIKSLLLTILMIFLFLSCQGFLFPNSSALSLAPFSKNAGTASGLMGAIQMSIGAGASALVSIMQNSTALPMSGVMALCAFLSLSVLLLSKRIIKYKCSKEAVEEEEVEMISTL